MVAYVTASDGISAESHHADVSKVDSLGTPDTDTLFPAQHTNTSLSQHVRQDTATWGKVCINVTPGCQ